MLSFDCQRRLAESSELILAGNAVLAVLCCWCMWEQSSRLCAWARCDHFWCLLKTRYLALPTDCAQWISYNWAVQQSAICRWYNDRNWTLYWLLCKTSFDVVQTRRSLEYYSRCLHTQRQDGFMYISFDRSFVPAQLIISEVVSAILFAMLKLPVSCFLNFQTLKC